MLRSFTKCSPIESRESSTDREYDIDPTLERLGVSLRNKSGKKQFVVDFAEEHDPFDPQRWSGARKWVTTAVVGCTGLLVGWASAIDSTVVPQAKAELKVGHDQCTKFSRHTDQRLQVGEIAETLAMALYLIAFGVGSLVSGPLSETFGRSPVYLGSLVLFMIWVMASGLAPNIAAQLAFRFLAGFFGCTPLTFGGSTHDMWSSLQSTSVFPTMACLSFLGPSLAPMVGAWIGQSESLSWRWTEWTTLIMAGLVTTAILLFAQETYPPVLLDWKAKQLRRIMNDDRYISSAALHETTFITKMRINLTRPFELFFTQIIIVLWCFYLPLVYIILFTFLPGYDFIFADTYGFSQGITGLMYIGLNVGFLVALSICPFVYRRYKRKEAEMDGNAPPEERLVYAMISAPLLPICLFWMGWTTRSSISFWSPLIASVVFGFCMQGIFISAYLYIIDTYEVYAASALVSLTLTRYIGAGGMTIAAGPMYEGIGVAWTLTLMGCVAVLCTPIPFLLYHFGAKIREKQSVE